MNVPCLTLFLASLWTASRGAPDFVFPDRIHHEVKQLPDYNEYGCPEDIPLDLARKLSNISDEEELFNFIEPNPRIIRGSVFDARIGGGGPTARSGVEKPVYGRCKPQLTLVSLEPVNADPSNIYMPACTRVNRCGGCCYSDLLACVPTATETRHFSVAVIDRSDTGTHTVKGKEVVTIEAHKACECQCRVKAEDCHSLQEYNAEECRCECTNVDREQKCKADKVKLWNRHTCSCDCREAIECSSGYMFDTQTCGCEPDRSQSKWSRNPEYDKISYNVEATYV